MKLLGRRKQVAPKPAETTDGVVAASDDAVEAKKHKGATSFVHARRIILRPLITEKAARLASEGKYVFEIARGAGQVEVQQEIARIYGVRPVAVNVQNYRGKRVRFGRRFGKRKAWKKAIVTLPKGEKIDVHEGV